MHFLHYVNVRICLQCRRPGFDHWVEKIPWRKIWQPTPVFSPRESPGQKSLAGYSPWGCKRVGHDLVTKPPNTSYVSWESYPQGVQMLNIIHTVCPCTLRTLLWMKEQTGLFAALRSSLMFYQPPGLFHDLWLTEAAISWSYFPSVDGVTQNPIPEPSDMDRLQVWATAICFVPQRQ